LRAGQDRAERDDFREGGIVEPTGTFDELAPEVAEMRDWAAERGRAES
jgi:hypothetical protein